MTLTQKFVSLNFRVLSTVASSHAPPGDSLQLNSEDEGLLKSLLAAGAFQMWYTIDRKITLTIEAGAEDNGKEQLRGSSSSCHEVRKFHA